MSDIKKYQGGSQSTLNHLNVSVVLDRIRNEISISRSGLAKSLQLSLPSISRIVDTLIDKEYVIEAGYGESTGGKKPKILRFNSSKSYVIGIAIDINFIDIILSDLSGNEKKYIHEEFLEGKDPNSIIDVLLGHIEKITIESEIDKNLVEVIAIGIPGMIEKNSNIIKLIPTIPSWEGVNVSEILFEKTGIRILMDNMNNMSLLGERWKGKAKDYNNVVFIGIGTGIGSGILIDGKLHRGFNGSAGEVGYMLIDKNLNKKVSDPQGQLEFLASDTALRSKISKICIENSNNFKNETSIIKSLINEPKYSEQITEIIDNFAYGVTNMITILNPELVVIEGFLFKDCSKAFDYLVQKVEQLSTFKTKIVLSDLGKKSISLGAVRSGIKYLDRKILSPLFL